MTVRPMTHVWHWRKYRPDRKGHACRVVCVANGRGPRNVMVEFADGEQVVAPRYAVRKAKRLDHDSPAVP